MTLCSVRPPPPYTQKAGAYITFYHNVTFKYVQDYVKKVPAPNFPSPLEVRLHTFQENKLI